MDPERTIERNPPAATSTMESLVLLMLFAGTGLLTLVLIFWVGVAAGTVPGTLNLLVADALIFLPFASLIGGLTATVRPRTAGRPWLGTATTVAMIGTLVTIFVLAVGMPSDAQRSTYRAAELARADAAARAAAQARPDITVVKGRFEQLRARIDQELSRTAPGARWPSAAMRDTRECDAGGGQRGVQIIDDGSVEIGPPGGTVSSAEWAATEAAVRRAAEPLGFTGRPLDRNGDTVGFTLTGPDDSVLQVFQRWPGSSVQAEMASGCHRPGPA